MSKVAGWEKGSGFRILLRWRKSMTNLLSLSFFFTRNAGDPAVARERWTTPMLIRVSISLAEALRSDILCGYGLGEYSKGAVVERIIGGTAFKHPNSGFVDLAFLTRFSMMVCAFSSDNDLYSSGNECMTGHTVNSGSFSTKLAS